MEAKSTAKNYIFLIRGPRWDADFSADETQEVMEEIMGWFDRLEKEGRIRAGSPLGSEGRILSGALNGQVVDGPFVESKESVGGFIMVEAASMEEAVSIAKSAPGLKYGMVLEVRESLEECPVQTRLREMRETAKV